MKVKCALAGGDLWPAPVEGRGDPRPRRGEDHSGVGLACSRGFLSALDHLGAASLALLLPRVGCVAVALGRVPLQWPAARRLAERVHEDGGRKIKAVIYARVTIQSSGGLWQSDERRQAV